jgi:hypothetical protein
MQLAFAVIASGVFLMAGRGHATALPEDMCDVAAQSAAETYQVPVKILLAVARAESGRQSRGQMRPWPWAVNLGGQGHWPDDKDSAVEIAQSALDEGRLNIDIGCFQLNIRWHSKGFLSLDDMFNPQTNADYAAQFLRQLHDEFGDWKMAVGAYHSRNAELATGYVDRVAALATNEPLPLRIAPANLFPLLRAGTAGSVGSIVPQSDAAATPLIGGGF